QLIGNDVAASICNSNSKHEAPQRSPKQHFNGQCPQRGPTYRQRAACGGSSTTTGLLVPTRWLFILLRISSAITWASAASRHPVGRINRISSVRARRLV